MIDNTELPSPVIALTVLDGRSLHEFDRADEKSLILLCIREPSTNRNHPNVISVPTQRIPLSTFSSLTVTALRESDFDKSTVFLEGRNISSGEGRGHSETIYAVNSLLSCKLGISEQLEAGTIKYHAHVAGLVRGVVEHPFESENTNMLNIVVVIDSGAELFPDHSASYSHIMWKPVDSFLDTARDGNLLHLNTNLNPFSYCIHGLCIKSAFNILAANLKRDPYAYPRS